MDRDKIESVVRVLINEKTGEIKLFAEKIVQEKGIQNSEKPIKSPKICKKHDIIWSKEYVMDNF